MANTMKALSTVTLGASAASISFTSIPATYTDLILKLSVRDNRAGGIDGSYMYFNSDTTSGNYLGRRIIGTGTSVSSSNTLTSLLVNATDSTSNTFSNNEVYIPNYASANTKSFSIDNAQENNDTTAYEALYAGLWNSTSPITSITLTPELGTLFLQYTTATLYGVFNADVSAAGVLIVYNSPPSAPPVAL
jgi:hypothetical protein